LELDGYFLYLYASMSLGAAYNSLFLRYIVIFSASLFAFIMVFSTAKLEPVAAQMPDGLLRRGLAIFMLVSGFVTLVAGCYSERRCAVWIIVARLHSQTGVR